MAMVGCREVGIDEPKGCKKLVVYVEMDRCATDAIQAVTGCSLGKRTLKFLDYGKMAATFINLETHQSWRVIARDDARDHVSSYVDDCTNRRAAEKAAYEVMPEDLLFRVQSIEVQIPEEDMPGVRSGRVLCRQCGEGINFKREITVGEHVLCVPCFQGTYMRARSNGDIGHPPMIHIVGRKNSGKTTLIEKVIPQLSARGYRVATVKHHHSERPIDIDWEGKDSWRHRKAGARAVAVISLSETALFQETDGSVSLSEVAANLKGVDVVLAEGFRSEAHFEIRIAGESTPFDPGWAGHKKLLAVVGGATPIDGIPTFDRDDIPALVDLIENTVLRSASN
jgi:formylmethanofuran dehydrogenase subunit E